MKTEITALRARITRAVITIMFFAIISGCKKSDDITIGDNTFVHDGHVYKVIDDEVVDLGNLSSDSLRTIQVRKATERDLGNSDLSFVKEGARANLTTVYRGTTLYYKLVIHGLNDLKEAYSLGTFVIQFMDEHGYTIKSIDVPTNELIGSLDDKNKVQYFDANGSADVSLHTYDAIKSYTVSSTVKKNSITNPWGNPPPPAPSYP